MPDQSNFKRNAEAEAALRARLHADSLAGLDLGVGAIPNGTLPIPASPFEHLKQPVLANPQTSSVLMRLLAQLRPTTKQLSGITQQLPPWAYLEATERGIPPAETNLMGNFSNKQQMYLDPSVDPQTQYETFLHELTHAAGSSERGVREFEELFKLGGQRSTKPGGFPALLMPPGKR